MVHQKRPTRNSMACKVSVNLKYSISPGYQDYAKIVFEFSRIFMKFPNFPRNRYELDMKTGDWFSDERKANWLCRTTASPAVLEVKRSSLVKFVANYRLIVLLDVLLFSAIFD